MTLLRGERVTLRPWRDGDLAPFAALNDDPAVMQHLSGRLSREDSDAMVARIREHFDSHGYGLWALDVPGIGFAGFVGLSAQVPFELELPGIEPHPHEIGWRLARAAWGRGYATEAATLALRHAFAHLHLPQVVSFTVPANAASQRVMQRIGLTLRGEFDHPRFPEGHRLRRHVLYAADAPDRAAVEIPDMAPPRIPPIHCLLSFEALARLRSVTLAADELNVTPSAVSHRMRQLESQLGVRLFARSDFTLSADGAVYLANVRQGLQALQQVPGHAPAQGTAKLRLAVTPTFSRQILLPRLALFRHAYPDVELILQVAIPMLDVKAEEADLEIRYGTGPYAGVEQVRILSDEIVPVCSPDYLNEAGPFDGFDNIEQVARARLIRSPLESWNTWFKACGIALPEPREGAQFNDVGLMLDAAAAGFGVTLMRLKLGRDWLDNGRLVRLSPRQVASPNHHFICWKAGTMDRWECAAFVDWLRLALN